jgi:hypothetical protein
LVGGEADANVLPLELQDRAGERGELKDSMDIWLSSARTARLCRHCLQYWTKQVAPIVMDGAEQTTVPLFAPFRGLGRRPLQRVSEHGGRVTVPLGTTRSGNGERDERGWIRPGQR